MVAVTVEYGVLAVYFQDRDLPVLRVHVSRVVDEFHDNTVRRDAI